MYDTSSERQEFIPYDLFEITCSVALSFLKTISCYPISRESVALT